MKNNMWCHLVSSVAPNIDLKKRPYGGIGYICKKSCDTMFKAMQCDSDRVLGLQISVNQHRVLSLIGVYLSCDSHGAQHMELYLNTIDHMQNMIENCPSVCLTFLMGDFNTVLPEAETIPENWY